MKLYYDLKAEMEGIQQQIVEAKKNKRTDTMKKVKKLCKKLGFTVDLPKGVLAEVRQKK